MKSQDVEAGLKKLLEKVIEVYGGEGRVKTRKSIGAGNVQYSFKYVGTESATKLLDQSLKNISDLQSKGNVWKYTQKIEVRIKEV